MLDAVQMSMVSVRRMASRVDSEKVEFDKIIMNATERSIQGLLYLNVPLVGCNNVKKRMRSFVTEPVNTLYEAVP